MNSTQPVKSSVGAAILVNEPVFKSEREDSRYSFRALVRHANLKRLTEMFRQIAEPTARLGGQAMTTARQSLQMIESLTQQIRSALLDNEALPLRSPDFSLYRALVKVAVQRIEFRA
jgi:hypothetical protein